MIDKTSLTVQIPKKAFNKVYLPSLYAKNRYLVFYGGAGSGKSYFIAQRFVIRLLEEKMCNVLVIRAYANTNKVSTYALLKQVISKWNLQKYFKCYDGEVKIKCILNGNEVVFKGLDDSEKLKSITFSSGDLTDIWVEEASEITNESDFNQLDVRLRGKGVKKQIVVSFNPVDVNHWLKKRFFDRKSDREIKIFHTTYKDNKFLDEDYVKLLESYKKTDPYYYSVYCLGVWGVFGETVFCAREIQKRLSECSPPLKKGYFLYEEQERNLKKINFFEDENGYIKIYDFPKKLHRYVIGGDTASEGADFFTAQVIDCETKKQVAVLKNKFDEDLYAKQLYCLGTYYNEALIAIESNFSSYPIKELLRLNYKKQYIRKKEDSFSNQTSKSYGFRTTSTTRPLIIANLVKISREHIDFINDEETLLEMLCFVRNSSGRAEAKAGSHDDLVMAIAIGFYVSQEQKNRIFYEETKTISDPFGLEKKKSAFTKIGEEVRFI